MYWAVFVMFLLIVLFSPAITGTAIAIPQSQTSTAEGNGTRIAFDVAETLRPKLFFQSYLLDDNHAWVWESTDLASPLKRTVDGGKSWVGMLPGRTARRELGNSLLGMYFLNEKRGWIGTTTGTWRTDDGGATWQRILPVGLSVMSLEGNQGWMSVYDVRQDVRTGYFSVNGGETWQQCQTKESPGLSHVVFLGRMGFAVGAVERDVYGVWKTTDGGCSWARTWTNYSERLWDRFCEIHFINEKEGWLAGCYVGHLMHTIDGGSTWESIQLPRGTPLIWGVHFENAAVGWIQTSKPGDGSYPEFHRTTDGGKTWIPVTIDDAKRIGVPTKWKGGRLTVLYSQP
jgi:photosystem II stability/assembly factor-like uncharacterized protein